MLWWLLVFAGETLDKKAEEAQELSQALVELKAQVEARYPEAAQRVADKCVCETLVATSCPIHPHVELSPAGDSSSSGDSEQSLSDQSTEAPPLLARPPDTQTDPRTESESPETPEPQL
jgi:hypothetical protein